MTFLHIMEVRSPVQLRRAQYNNRTKEDLALPSWMGAYIHYKGTTHQDLIVAGLNLKMGCFLPVSLSNIWSRSRL